MDKYTDAEAHLIELMSEDEASSAARSRPFSEADNVLGQNGLAAGSGKIVPMPDTPPDLWTTGGVSGALRHHSRRLIAILGVEALALGILLIVAFTMLRG